jgi:PAS domain S-box-containing protein
MAKWRRYSLEKRTMLADAVRTGRTILLWSLAEWEAAYPDSYPDMCAHGFSAAAAAPLKVGNNVLGGVIFYFAEAREFGEGEEAFLTAIAGQTAQALERAQLYEVTQKHSAELNRANELLKAQSEELSANNQALRESEERYRGIVETANEGIATHDLEGTITYVNQRMADMLGYSSETIIGKSSLDFVEESEREAVLRAGDSAIDKGNFIQECKLLRKNGSFLWTLVNVTPRRDRAGSLTGYLAMHTDITERKKTDEVLRASEERLRLIAQAGSIGFFEWNSSRDSSYWSPEHYAIFGYEPDSSITYERWLASVHPDDREFVTQNITQLMERASRGDKGYTQKSEYRIIRHGTTCWLETEATLDIKGGEIVVRGFIRDITARKIAEQETARLASFPILNPNPILELELSGNIVFMNPSAQAAFPDLQNRGLEHPFLVDWKNLRDASISRGIAQREVAVSECWYNQTAHYLKDAQKIRIYSLDITPRKRAEVSLRESEEKFRGLFYWMGGGIQLCELVFDEEGQAVNNIILDVNPAYEKQTGLSRDQVVGRRIKEILPTVERAWLDRYSEVVRKGVTMQFEEYNSSLDKWFEVFANPMGGNRFAAVFTDITERKLAEEEQKRLTEIQQLALSTADMFAWSYDPASKEVLFTDNAQEVLGTGNPKNSDRGYELLHPDDRDAHRILVNHAVSEVGSYSSTYRHLHEDGEVLWFEERGRAIPDRAGKTLGLVGVTQNITERKQVEEELKRSKEDLELKVKERTHELETKTVQLRALTSELALTELRERRRLAKILHDHLQQILVGSKFRLSVLSRGVDELTKEGIKEVEELIDESIRVSRSLTAELSPPILHEAGLNAGLEWLAKRMAENHALFVELNMEQVGNLHEPLTILLFETARELLFNVVKHARVKSAVVSLRRIRGALQLSVSDDGLGFDPSSIPTVGESGSGYGLFGIRERLHHLGGHLDVQSSPGQGSQFIITVPVEQAPVEQISLTPEKLHAEVTSAPPHKNIRLILADDHAVVRQGLSTVLGSENDIEVVGLASNGREAVDLAAKLLPDVILMDVSMPVLNGVEAARIIRNEYPDICVIGLSMFEETERAQAMRDAGASDYLTKSGPIEELVSAIRKAVSTLRKNYSASTN